MPDPARLEVETAFERLVLDSATPLIEPQYGWVDLRISLLGDVGFMIGAAVCGTQAADQLRTDLRPLMFGAAWKVLDLVVEQALPVRSANWSIRAKVNRAQHLDVPVWHPFAKSDAE